MALLDSDRSYEHSTVKFHHPFTFIVAGPTSCGKSVFVENFIKEGPSILSERFSKILWCYGEWQERYFHLQSQFGVLFHEGLRDLAAFVGKAPDLIVIDDLMHGANGTISQVFTKR